MSYIASRAWKARWTHIAPDEYVKEWGCTLEDAVQFTGEPTSRSLLVYRGVLTRGPRCRHPRSWFQQLRLGSSERLLRASAGYDRELSGLCHLVHLEGASYQLFLFHGRVRVRPELPRSR